LGKKLEMIIFNF